MMRQFRIARAFLGMNIREFMAEKANFWMFFITTLLRQCLFLIFLSVVFAQIPDIQGWDFYQILFIYGFFTCISGFFYTFFAWTLWFPGKYILNNGLDRLLTLPSNSFFLVICEEFGSSVMEIFSIIFGAVFMLIAAFHLQMELNGLLVVNILLGLPGAVLVVSGVFVLLTAISFWIKSQVPLCNPMMHFMDFAQYPITIYHRWLQVILTWIVPFGFIGFFPASAIIKTQEYGWYGLYTLIWGFVLFAVSYSVWCLGIQRYESTGS